MAVYPPAHVRLTLMGTLPAGELFNCTLSLKGVRDGLPDPDPVDAIDYDLELGGVIPVPGSTSAMTRVSQAVQSFWSAPTAHIGATAILKTIRFAPIGDDGKYLAASKDVTCNVAGAETIASNQPPNQIARKVTLESDGDLGRVKGGFYLPQPSLDGYDRGQQLAAAYMADNVRNRVAEMLGDIESNEVTDPFHWRVVIASAGRHNKDGSLRRPPTLHDVTGVTVGRRLDVQRRRANKVAEARNSLATF